MGFPEWLLDLLRSTRTTRALQPLSPHLCVAHAGGGHQGLLHRLALANPGDLLLVLG